MATKYFVEFSQKKMNLLKSYKKYCKFGTEHGSFRAHPQQSNEERNTKSSTTIHDNRLTHTQESQRSTMTPPVSPHRNPRKYKIESIISGY